jgi:hypothetical protein
MDDGAAAVQGRCGKLSRYDDSRRVAILNIHRASEPEDIIVKNR